MSRNFLDKVSNKVIGEILTDKGILTADELAGALKFAEEQGIRLGEALLRLELISQDILNYVLAEQYGVLPIELETSMVDKELVNRFPMDYLKQNSILPLIMFDHNLVVVISDPTTQQALEKLSHYAPNVSITVQLSDKSKIQKCLTFAEADLPDKEVNQEAAYKDVFDSLCRVAVANVGATLTLRETDDLPELTNDNKTNNLTSLNFPFKVYKLADYLEKTLQKVEFTHDYWKSFRYAGGNDRFIVLFGFVKSAYNCTVIRFKAIQLIPSSYESAGGISFHDKISVLEYESVEHAEELISNISSSQVSDAVLLVTNTVSRVPTSVYFYPKDFLDIPRVAMAMGCKTIIFDYTVSVGALQSLLSQLPLDSHVFIIYSKEQNPGYANLLRLFSPSREHGLNGPNAGTSEGVEA